MKVVCSTVIRAAEQGSVHGGLYVIDINNDKIYQYSTATSYSGTSRISVG